MSDYDSDSSYEKALKKLEELEITVKEIKKELLSVAERCSQKANLFFSFFLKNTLIVYKSQVLFF